MQLLLCVPESVIEDVSPKKKAEVEMRLPSEC
jgi:hypothetical protein